MRRLRNQHISVIGIYMAPLHLARTERIKIQLVAMLSMQSSHRALGTASLAGKSLPAAGDPLKGSSMCGEPGTEGREGEKGAGTCGEQGRRQRGLWGVGSGEQGDLGPPRQGRCWGCLPDVQAELPSPGAPSSCVCSGRDPPP